MTASEDLPLDVWIHNGELIIRIGVRALVKAYEYGGMDHDMRDDFVITDTAVFAGEVLGVLNEEEEDGYTRVHRMLDEAMNHAIEYGCEGVEEKA